MRQPVLYLLVFIVVGAALDLDPWLDEVDDMSGSMPERALATTSGSVGSLGSAGTPAPTPAPTPTDGSDDTGLIAAGVGAGLAAVAAVAAGPSVAAAAAAPAATSTVLSFISYGALALVTTGGGALAYVRSRRRSYSYVPDGGLHSENRLII